MPLPTKRRPIDTEGQAPQRSGDGVTNAPALL